MESTTYVDPYHPRNLNEMVPSAITQKFGAVMRSHRVDAVLKLVTKCFVHNPERSLDIPNKARDGP